MKSRAGFDAGTVLQPEGLPQYRLESLLGLGSYGEVWKVKQDEQFFAIKFLYPKTPRKNVKEFLKIVTRRFHHEFAVQKRLPKGICPTVYEMSRHENILLYVMEYLDGLTLDEGILRRRTLKTSRIDWLIARICRAVHQLHRHGFLHLELKPQNIMFSSLFGVRLLDFFDSTRITSFDQYKKLTSKKAFTFEYASPELRNRQSVSTRSDVYALGVMLFQMYTLRPPFDSASLKKHDSLPEFPRELALDYRIPKDVISVIEQAVSEDPDDRFRTAKDFYRAFQAASKSSP